MWELQLDIVPLEAHNDIYKKYRVSFVKINKLNYFGAIYINVHQGILKFIKEFKKNNNAYMCI